MDAKFQWPEGKRAAVSIAYERCPTQALERLPTLTEAGIAATVFLEPTDILDDPPAWRERVGGIHELGNAMLHPFTEDGSLPNWTREMLSDDLDMADDLLAEFSSNPDLTFALPGTNTTCADGSYDSILFERFRWIKGCNRGVNHPVFSTPQSLSQLLINDQTAAETLTAFEEGIKLGAWCILCFDLRTQVVRRFHDAFINVAPNAHPNILWKPISAVGQIVSDFRSQLTVR